MGNNHRQGKQLTPGVNFVKIIFFCVEGTTDNSYTSKLALVTSMKPEKCLRGQGLILGPLLPTTKQISTPTELITEILTYGF